MKFNYAFSTLGSISHWKHVLLLFTYGYPSRQRGSERILIELALSPVQIAQPGKLAQAAVYFGDNSSEDEMLKCRRSTICIDKCAFSPFSSVCALSLARSLWPNRADSTTKGKMITDQKLSFYPQLSTPIHCLSPFRHSLSLALSLSLSLRTRR